MRGLGLTEGYSNEPYRQNPYSLGVYILMDGDKGSSNKQDMSYDKFSKSELKRDTLGQAILERVVQDGFSFELRLEEHAKCWGKHCRKREQQEHKP